ncbi:MAG: LysR substrate-binding domain-containing protein [Pseudomonadota bacterium]
MSQYLPPLNAVRAFEAAGRHESFSQAADELNVTHAAISRHVRGLEKQLGVQFFRNIARGVELTEIGCEYLQKVSPALNQISEASEAIRTRRDGSLSISCEPTFAMKWLMPKLGEFQNKYPDFEVSLISSAHLADIQNNEVDMAIRFYNRTRADGVETDLISSLPVYPYGVPAIPVAKSPDELLKYRLLHEDKGQLWTRWFHRSGKTDFAIQKTSQPLQTLLAIEGAIAGQGIALTSAELVANDVDQGKLKCLSEVGLELGQYHLVYSREAKRRKPVQAFREWLITETRQFRK